MGESEKREKIKCMQQQFHQLNKRIKEGVTDDMRGTCQSTIKFENTHDKNDSVKRMRN